SPEGGGLGSVQLDVTVVEQATDYAETTTRLVSVAQGPVALRIIPDGSSFKPGLPLTLLIVTETPGQQPVDATVRINMSWQDDEYGQTGSDNETVETVNGVATLTITPPNDAVILTLDAAADDTSWAYLTLRAGYSPSSTFVHVAQETTGSLSVGQTARFRISATSEARSFFYEVLARGKVVFSDVSETPEIDVTLTPLMAPEARLLVYQILSNGEVAADYIPFSVSGDYPLAVTVDPGTEEVEPGDELEIAVRTDGPARVGLVAVDRSVFILAENRLNLQQVFAELERLSLLPQAELHEAEGGIEFQPMFDPWGPMKIPGAEDTFHDAGVIVLTNQTVPEGKEIEPQMFRMAATGAEEAENADDSAASMATPASGAAVPDTASQAQPQRIRQFFPETWIWSDLTTDDDGRAVQTATAPDSITTWMFRAVALSRELGLGIGEAELRVFQPFFVTVDLPFAAIRGEEFPASVALYNYTQSAEEFTVELEPDDWFEPLAGLSQTVTVGPNEVGAAAFPIRTTALGVHPLRVTARGTSVADAIVKEMIVEPEGVPREQVENLVLASGSEREVDLSLPDFTVDGSGRAFIALTGNVLSQTMDGLESLLQMSFGCGEQNMILFSPNVFVTRYLNETGQLKPEVRARAETLMLTGYQREMTYRRSDGSFSAFGESDPVGSLWLTAFVLKTFAQASDLVYIDESVLASGREWIRSHQSSDGSFEPVGFVHHTELLGGLEGRTALTAFIAIALHEAGDTDGASAAGDFLVGELASTTDAYPLALTTYALALIDSGQADAALNALMARRTTRGSTGATSRNRSK
ncbi:MAG: alpha-2-macroglobulin, partial [Chloroflexota bacterium]|nr:alpha-2-macroglobulin [Chloroflexota bacterium]